MTHLQFSIRIISLDFLDLFIQLHPQLLHNFISHLLPNYVNLLSISYRAMGSSAAAPTSTPSSATQNTKPNKNILSSSVQVRTRLLSSFLKFLKFALQSLNLRKQHRFFIYKPKLTKDDNNNNNNINISTEVDENMKIDSNDNSDRNQNNFVNNNTIEYTWKENEMTQNYEKESTLTPLLHPPMRTTVTLTSSLLSNASNVSSNNDQNNDQQTTSKKESAVRSLENIKDVQDLSIELIPQLIEHWLECTPGEYPNTPDNLTALQLILDLMVLLIGASSEPSHHPTANLSYQNQLISTILPLFTRYVIVYFPFVSRTLVTNTGNSVDFAQKLNESISVLMTSFLKAENLGDDWSISIYQFLVRSIEKKKLNASLYVVLFHYSTLPVHSASNSFQMKMNLLRNFTDFAKQIQPRDQFVKEYSITFIVEVMNREIDFTLDVAKKRVFKNAIVYKPSLSSPSSNNNNDILAGNINEILEEWMTLLAKFIWQIGNKQIDISKNILNLFQRFASCSLNDPKFRAIFSNFQMKLSPFFFAKFKGKNHFGPFSSLPISLQKKSIELFYYFENISPSILYAVAQCCSKIEIDSIIYLLEIISYELAILPEDLANFLFDVFNFVHENFANQELTYQSRIQIILSRIQNILFSSPQTLAYLFPLILDQLKSQSAELNDNDNQLLQSQLTFYSICLQVQRKVKSLSDIETIVYVELLKFISSNNLIDEPAETIQTNFISKFFPIK